MSGPYEYSVGQIVPNPIGTLYADELLDIVPGAIALYDFGDPWGYLAQASPIPAGTAIRSYLDAGNTAIVSGAPGWSGNMMRLTSVAQSVALPAEWKLPTSTTRFAVGGYMTIPRSGYAINGTGTGFSSLFGWSQTNGSNTQYALRVNYDRATGLSSLIYFYANGYAADITAAIPTDGAVHHYAFEMSVLTSTTFVVKVYVDGVLAFTSAAQTWTGSLVVPVGGTGPMLGAYYPNATDIKGAIGRIWLWDLTATGVKTIADLNAADIAGSVGRFS
ncbi:hypothetical protein [Sphingomonas sp. NFX23]|uniref:hypothetical protein n=1 Tax=Sphingomonas sp. NFX23 TaxID=2819532 RepID=UPI003CFB28EC